jgi:preprotein translocase subunit YajC
LLQGRGCIDSRLQPKRSGLSSGSPRRIRPVADPPQFQMLFLLLAQAQPGAPSGPGGGLGVFVPFILIFVIMYFLLFRPQRKRQQEQQRLVAALKTGDRVVTNAGIHGLIANVKETTVMLKVADNVKIEMEKSAITNVLKPEAAKQ